MSLITAEPRKVLFAIWVIHLTAIGFLLASWFWVFWDHAVKYGVDKVTLFTVTILLIALSVVVFMLFWARKRLKAEEKTFLSVDLGQEQAKKIRSFQDIDRLHASKRQ